MISSLIPKFIRKKIYTRVRNSILKSLKKQSDAIPKTQLALESISSARLLPTREVLLDHLPKDGIVAELGVDKGEFSEKILSINEPKKLHLIDVWATERYHQGKRIEVENKFRKQIDNGKVEINIGYSTKIVNQFPEEYFDWIYIDTDHSYEVTRLELELWCSKIKPGGFICGHDYILGNWNGLIRYGVIEAVHEFCFEKNWEILYLTMELDISPSFVIRKNRNENL